MPRHTMSRMLRFVVFVACWLVAIAPNAAAQQKCAKGTPCGRTCIASDKTCRTVASDDGVANSKTAAAEKEEVGSTKAGRWVASKAGTTYYRAGCSGTVNLAVKNLIYFTTEAAAKKAGYTRSKADGC